MTRILERELQQAYQQELKFKAGEAIKGATTSMDGTMQHWAGGILIRSRTPQQAIERWRAIESRGGRTPNDFTPTQHSLLRLPDTKIVDLYEQVHEADNPSGVLEELNKRQRSTYAWNDRHEKDTTPVRSLEQMRRQGVHVEYVGNALPATDGNCSLSDIVKNEKVLIINNIHTPAKISLVPHDAFDHLWTFQQLHDAGVLDAYRPFLHAVGDPDQTDLYKREGELVASTAFEWRAAHTPERAFKPVLGMRQIKQILEHSPNPTDNQRRALATISNLDSQSAVAAKLPSIYSGILVELLEQRRKNGMIKLLDQDRSVVGSLPFTDPEYLAFVIDMVGLLTKRAPEAIRVLQSVELMTEQFLQNVANGTTRSFSIRNEDLGNPEHHGLDIPPARRQFIFDNPFHSATRTLSCD